MTQTTILRTAAQRDDHNVLPLPGTLRGGAAAKVVAVLLTRGLIAETTIDSQTKADGALHRIWAQLRGGPRRSPSPDRRWPRRRWLNPTAARSGRLSAMRRLRRRGAFAGALKKRLGLEVASEKVEGCGRVYRLPPA